MRNNLLVNRTRPASRKVPRGGWLTGAGVAGLSTLVALSLLAGAVHPAVTLKAPYSGTVSRVGGSGYVNGCSAKATFPVKPTWNPKNGSVAVSGAAAAKGCPGLSAVSYAQASSLIEIAIPVRASTNGTHSVAVDWRYGINLPVSIRTGGRCPSPVLDSMGSGQSSCQVSAGAGFSVQLWLIDFTNGSQWYPTNYWPGTHNDSFVSTGEYCYYWTCSYQNSSTHTNGVVGSHSFTWYLNATFNMTDTVALVVDVQFDASADVSGYAKGAAIAAYNFATAGNGGKLASITVR
jgi:hypothetical protein